MKYIGSIGVGNVLSELGLLESELGGPWISEMIFIERACRRFEVRPDEVLEALIDAENENLVKRTVDGIQILRHDH